MLGLKRRHTYDELLNIIKSDGEKKVELPNRIASQIRGSIKYQGLLNDHLNELQEIQNKVHKQSILTHEIRQQKGTGNHQINMRLSNDGDNDGDNDSAMPPLETITNNSSSNNTSSSSSSSSSSSDITSTISSVEDELERKKQDQLKRITEPDTREYISKSIEGKMLEERAKINKAVTEGSTKKGAYDKKFMEMWRAFKNYELGDNKEFESDLLELHYRIKHIGDYTNPEEFKEERDKINEGIDELYGEYLKFKSAVHVHIPEYAAMHKEAMAKVKAK